MDLLGVEVVIPRLQPPVASNCTLLHVTQDSTCILRRSLLELASYRPRQAGLFLVGHLAEGSFPPVSHFIVVLTRMNFLPELYQGWRNKSAAFVGGWESLTWLIRLYRLPTGSGMWLLGSKVAIIELGLLSSCPMLWITPLTIKVRFMFYCTRVFQTWLSNDLENWYYLTGIFFFTRRSSWST